MSRLELQSELEILQRRFDINQSRLEIIQSGLLGSLCTSVSHPSPPYGEKSGRKRLWFGVSPIFPRRGGGVRNGCTQANFPGFQRRTCDVIYSLWLDEYLMNNYWVWEGRQRYTRKDQPIHQHLSNWGRKSCHSHCEVLPNSEALHSWNTQNLVHIISLSGPPVGNCISSTIPSSISHPNNCYSWDRCYSSSQRTLL